MSAAWVARLEDLTQADSDTVGRKCANLGELTRAGFQVPPGFALSLEAYQVFLESTGVGEQIRRFFAAFAADPDDPKQLPQFTEASATVRRMVEAHEMPRDMVDTVAGHYGDLCEGAGIDDVPVATRSAGPVSHPGQYESFLNVTGLAAVTENVIKVWSSTFNTRSLVARARKGLPLDRDPIGVVVLKMVDADAAGVMFTAEPTTADAARVVIEGSRGLGEVVVSGAVIPDNWTVDAKEFTVVERRVVGTDEQPCLLDEEVVELARIGKLIEAHFGKPQDIEWAIDRDAPSNPVFILQARPETFRINFRF